MRDLMAGLAAMVVAAAALGGGAWLVLNRIESDPLAEGSAVLQSYATAWEERDAAAMAALVDEPPEDFVELHRQMWEALAVEDVRVSLGEVTLQGSQVDADVTVAVDLPRAGALEHDTRLTAQRRDGEWLVLWEASVLHPELDPTYTWDVVTEAGTRAPILAHDGAPLTGPGTVHQIGIEPRRIRDEDDLVSAVATTLPDAVDDLQDLLARDDLRGDWFYPVVTIGAERFEAVWDVLRPLPGVLQREQEGRVRFDDSFGLHVLGRVAELTAEQLEELGPPYEPGDEAGIYGLELAFEEQLTGGPTVRVVLREPDDDVATVVHEHRGDEPSPVETTLDTDIQRAVEDALAGVQSPAAIVVVDTGGAVRAAASRPLGGYNRAFEGRYPPGSAFKIVTAEALLADGAEPDDVVECPDQITVGGLAVTNAGDLALDSTTLREAFAHSCNTTFAPLATELPAGALAAAAERFGFGVELDLPLAAFGGSFPEPADRAEVGAAAFGQGRVEASPLHLATVAAATIDGSWNAPRLMTGSESVASRRLTDSAMGDLRELLRAAVTDGTGEAADVAGREVRGKTGTAQTAADPDAPTHAWFVGTSGDLGMAVLVEGGGGGGEVAAPLAARLLRELGPPGAD